MKKFQMMLLSISAAAVLVGCGSGNSSTNPTGNLTPTVNTLSTNDIARNIEATKVILKEKQNSGADQEEIDRLKAKIEVLEKELEDKKSELADAQKCQAELEKMKGCVNCLKQRTAELKKLVLAFADPDISEFLKDKDSSISTIIEDTIKNYEALKAKKEQVDKETAEVDSKIDEGLSQQPMTNDEEKEFMTFLNSEADKLLNFLKDAYKPYKECKEKADALQEKADAKKKAYEELVKKATEHAEKLDRIEEIDVQLETIAASIESERKAILDALVAGQEPDYTTYNELKKLKSDLEAEKRELEKVKCEDNVTIEDIVKAKNEADKAQEAADKAKAECDALKADADKVRLTIIEIENAKEDAEKYGNINWLSQAIKDANSLKREIVDKQLQEAEEQLELAKKLDDIINPPAPTGATGASNP
jgi:chromosome segregation ATPase